VIQDVEGRENTILCLAHDTLGVPFLAVLSKQLFPTELWRLELPSGEAMCLVSLFLCSF